MIKRLIFDIDDTLIVGASYTTGIEKTLKRINMYSNNNLELFMKAINTYEQIYNNYNIIDYVNHIQSVLNKKLPSNFIEIFFDELKTCVPPFNKKLISTIKQLSYKYELVLLTNFFAQSQMNRLNAMKIGKYFNACYGENLIKPNKMAYIEACGAHKPNECVMIGDDLLLDCKKAQEIDLKTIFVNTKRINIKEKIGIVIDKIEDISQELINILN